MLLSRVFERFVEKTPFAVLAQELLLERTLTPEALDKLFEDKADAQCTPQVDLLLGRRSDGPGRHECLPLVSPNL